MSYSYSSGPDPTPVDGTEPSAPDDTTPGPEANRDPVESALADIEAGADQLLSTAVPDGLSNPFSFAQGGWIVGSQPGDPLSGEAAGSGDSNSFTGGQNVDPFTGDRNTESFTVGPLAPLISSPLLLAFNAPDPANANTASDVGGPTYIGTANSDGSGTLDTPSPPVNVDSGRIYVDATILWGVDRIDAVSRDGVEYQHYQVTIGNVTYDAYLNDMHSPPNVPLNQVELVPASSAASPPGTFQQTASASSVAPNPTQTQQSDQADSHSAISQIFRGTYADSVVQMQLSNQGQVTGSFVSPFASNDYLFNPNATSLVDAMLLAAHSPNAQLIRAQSLQLGVSMTPIIGSVSTWMNPNSGWFAKGLAVVGAAAAILPGVSELAGLNSQAELGSLSTEVDGALAEEAQEAGTISEEATPEIAEGNDQLAPGVRSRGNAANQIKSIIGNEASVYFVQEADPGAVLIGKEVAIRVNGVKTELDNLFVSSGGELLGVEAKFGQYARFTSNQSAVYPRGGGWVVAIPEGPAALEAGLAVGEPVVVYLFRTRFNWPLGGP